MFYYNIWLANGGILEVISDGDPINEVPVDLRDEVISVTTICEA